MNPKYKTVHGLATVKSISDLEPGVDLAIIATPIHMVPDIVRDCVENKMAGAIIISAGGKEVGEEGRKIEEQIRAIAYAGGLRIVGPNTWVSFSPMGNSMPALPRGRMPATWPPSPRRGHLHGNLDLAFKSI